jgi:hypothetical protein
MSVIGITAYIMSYSIMQSEHMKRSFHGTVAVAAAARILSANSGKVLGSCGT